MSETEWTQRELCPDGACVGVIGDDGTCKVCGRAAPNWGDERQRGLQVQAEADDVADDEDDEDGEYEDDDEDGEYEDDEEDDDEPDEGDTEGTIEAKAPEPKPAAKGSGEWSKRKLCPDGGCVGVIGDNGKCKVCGKKG